MLNKEQVISINVMSYTKFQDFVTAARSTQVKKADETTVFNSRSFVEASNRQSTQIPLEGVAPAIFPGFHIYVKLDLAPHFTTSSNNKDRGKNIRLLGELTQGVKFIVDGRFDGASGACVYS
jgi:hypothetical protein